MTPEEKELQRHHDILLATLQYLLEKTAGRVKVGQLDPVAVYFQEVELRVARQFRKGNLKGLQKLLRETTEGLRSGGDLDYSGYIKEKTGHHIDLFGNLGASVDKILRQKMIRNRNEHLDASAQFHIYRQTPGQEEHREALARLLNDFEARQGRRRSSGRNAPLRNEVSESYSPDKGRRVTVTESGTGPNNLVTQVSVHFAGAGAGVYAVPGRNPGIRAYWKDNSTLVIETPKDLTTLTRHEQLQSLDDVVRVEYVES